jgi:hypothetical protein
MEAEIKMAMNFFSFFTKYFYIVKKKNVFMCYDPKIVIIELSLSYLSRYAPLRAGICGVSGRNKVSAGRKIFFCDLSKLSWTEESIAVQNKIYFFSNFHCKTYIEHNL